jgi:hypothetical protein
MPISSLSHNDARLVHLAAQGLLNPPPDASSKPDVLSAIRRMQLLQIDTINVVARSPYLVLFSRLGAYDPAWLEELLAEGSLFEQWAHAACFIPIEDYPFIRRHILDGMRDKYFDGWIDQHRPGVEQVLEHVRQNGQVRSADFKSRKEEPGGWWNWKFEKSALEYWLSTGDLMVVRRENFQRVYDLRERVYPGWDDTKAPPREEVDRALILKSITALGIARREWVADYYRLPKKLVAGLLPALIEEGRLLEVSVEGWENPVLYTPENQSLIEAALAGELYASHSTLLSPFDPVVWDRARARQLFDFDFMIQAYTPSAKRQFGYFPLPILHNGALIGRLDAKAHRREGIFEVRGLYLEEGVELAAGVAQELHGVVKRCAEWHRTPMVVYSDTVQPNFREYLSSLV